MAEAGSVTAALVPVPPVPSLATSACQPGSAAEVAAAQPQACQQPSLAQAPTPAIYLPYLGALKASSSSAIHPPLLYIRSPQPASTLTYPATSQGPASVSIFHPSRMLQDYSPCGPIMIDQPGAQPHLNPFTMPQICSMQAGLLFLSPLPDYYQNAPRLRPLVLSSAVVSGIAPSMAGCSTPGGLMPEGLSDIGVAEHAPCYLPGPILAPLSLLPRPEAVMSMPGQARQLSFDQGPRQASASSPCLQAEHAARGSQLGHAPGYRGEPQLHMARHHEHGSPALRISAVAAPRLCSCRKPEQSAHLLWQRAARQHGNPCIACTAQQLYTKELVVLAEIMYGNMENHRMHQG